jgi:hypothetical protein
VDGSAGSVDRSSDSCSAAVVGRCIACATPHDSYAYATEGGRRCRICRVLILVCDACWHRSGSTAAAPGGAGEKLFFCERHAAWRADVASGKPALAKRRRALEAKLGTVRGRKLKRQRQQVKKEIETVDAVAAAVAAAAAAAEGR